VCAEYAIRVAAKSHVPIAIGAGGGVIQWVRDAAEASATEMLGRDVHLRLRVVCAA